MIARALLAAAAAGMTAAPSAPTASADEAGMALGVQTHFSQGWSPAWFGKAGQAQAGRVRDGVSWSAVETQRGVYRFPPATDAYVAQARRRSMRLLLTVVPANPLYDGGRTAFSPEARKAFCGFLDALLARYGDQVEALEIGNEINTDGAVTGPAARATPGAYVELLKDAYAAVKRRRPEVQVLGGSTNVIGTGFLETLFQAGALDHLDGVAVHPYRATPEGVEGEIAHLREAMRRHGGEKPIYATEFGDYFADPALAPAHMLKMYALMSAAGVRQAYWYALADEPWFPNMGLYDRLGQAKPAAGAFRLIRAELEPLGRAVRVDAGDPRTLVFRFGADRYVMWAAARPVVFRGPAHARDARGRPIALPARLGADPVVVDGLSSYELGPEPVLADTLLDYRQGAWSYFARTPDGRMRALRLVDWRWTSYMGQPDLQPLRISADGVAAAGDQGHPAQAVERYVSPGAGRVRITGRLRPDRSGRGVSLQVLHNDQILYQGLAAGDFVLPPLTAELKAGDRVEVRVGPGPAPTGNATTLRVQILRDVDGAAAIPAR